MSAKSKAPQANVNPNNGEHFLTAGEKATFNLVAQVTDLIKGIKVIKRLC